METEQRCGMPAAMMMLALYGLVFGGFVAAVVLGVMWLVWG